MFVLNYYKGHIENRLKACFNNQDVETVASEYSYRLNVIEIFKRNNFVPNVTYLVNTMSEHDINDQLIPFINDLKCLEYFDDQLMYYKEPNGHAGVYDKEKTIKLIKSHFKY